MAEMTEQKQEAAAKAEQVKQEAAPASTSTPAVSAGSGSPRPDESNDELKLRLNANAQQERVAKEAAIGKVASLEAELEKIRLEREVAKKEQERAEMTATQKAEAERDDVLQQLAEERRLSNKLTLEQAATRLAADLGFRNPVLASTLVAPKTVIVDGTIDMTKLREQIESIAANNDYMLNKPPPAARVGPTNNPADIEPPVSPVNLKAGQDPTMALMEQKKRAADRLRSGVNPLAAQEYVAAAVELNRSNPEARSGRMFGSGAIPERTGG